MIGVTQHISIKLSWLDTSFTSQVLQTTVSDVFLDDTTSVQKHLVC